MNKYIERLYNGIIKENPTFVLMLGMCPTLAVLSPEVEPEFNSYYVEDGDYWKIDNITLGYSFGQVGKYIKSLRVYGSVLNALTITGYKGIDPEVSTDGLTPGYDTRDRYPSVRSFTFGVNVKF